jgi:uncharacterized YigZ family protein
MDDLYLSPGDGPQVELRVRASRFLGQVFAAEDEPTAQAQLSSLRRRYHDASHHCWALRLGEPQSLQERADDDGEPHGTAGRPILAALQREKLCDALLVVTRYFGGKLGTGGLTRAYAECAAQALAAAPRRERFVTRVLHLECDFAELGAVEAVLSRRTAWLRSITRGFAPRPQLTLCVLRSHGSALHEEIVAASAGRARLQWVADPRSTGHES